MRGLGLNHVLHAVQVKPADAEHEVEVHPRFFRALDGGKVVDGLHARLDGLELRLRHEVSLVHHEPVGERHLLQGLIDHALGLLLVQVPHRVLGIHEGHNAVQAKRVQQVGLEVKGLYDGRGVRQTGGLDQDVIELAFPLRHQFAEHVHQVAAHRAAQATVVQQQDVLLRVVLERHKFAVDVDLTELILDDNDALTVVAFQDVVQQRGLAGSARGGKGGRVRNRQEKKNNVTRLGFFRHRRITQPPRWGRRVLGRTREENFRRTHPRKPVKTVTGTRLSFTASAPAAAQETLRRREARAGRIDAPRVTCWAPFAARWPRNEAGVTPP